MPANIAVLWDLDGVIVDTAQAHYRSFQVVLDEYGVSIGQELFPRYFGMTTAEIIRSVLPDPAPALVLEIENRKEALFRQMIRGKLVTHPGVRDWLERLSQQGIPLALATSTSQENIDAILQEIGLGAYFNIIVSAAEMPSKPNPRVFLEAARQLSIPAQNCIVIEDAIAGVAAAKRAGMKCIAVTTTNPPDALGAADLVVERLDRLSPNAFQQLAQSLYP
jgi:beta-phosphoglucomutase family hydrolase